MIDQVTARFIRRTIVGLLLAGLIALGYFVLQPFLIPVAWAMIIAYTSWPIYSFLYRSLKVNATLSALLMTMLITTAFILLPRCGSFHCCVMKSAPSIPI